MRDGDLEAQGRGLIEFKKKALSTIERARGGKIKDIDVVPPHIEQKHSQSKYEPMERNIKIKTLSELRNTPPPSFMVADYIIENSFAVPFMAHLPALNLFSNGLGFISGAWHRLE